MSESTQLSEQQPADAGSDTGSDTGTVAEADLSSLVNTLETQPPGRYDEDVMKALERLRAQGVSFNDMTVTMLAKEVGISRVTFYSHYGDKRRVVAMLAERTAWQIAREVEVWYRLAERLTYDELFEVQERILDIMETHRTTLDLLIETSTYDDELKKFYIGIKGTIGTMLDEVIVKLKAAGRCDPAIPEGFGIVMANMFERNYYYFAAAPGQDRDPRLAEWIAQAYWRLIYCHHQEAAPTPGVS